MSARLARRRSGEASGRAISRDRRHFRVRKNLVGTAERPRLVITRSLRHIVAQVVDDSRGHTLIAASSLDDGVRETKTNKTATAAAVGTLIAQRATAAGITRVVFDRGGNQYAGRIAALADAARAAGLEF